MASNTHSSSNEQRMATALPSKRMPADEQDLEPADTPNTLITSAGSFPADNHPPATLSGSGDRPASPVQGEEEGGVGAEAEEEALKAELEGLTEEMQSLLQDPEEAARKSGMPVVIDVAAKVLLYISSDRSCPPPRSTKFQEMAAGGSAELTAFLEACEDPPDQYVFAKAADAMVDRASTTYYFGSEEELDAEVAGALQLLAHHPSLRSLCATEAAVLDNYEGLKAACEPD